MSGVFRFSIEVSPKPDRSGGTKLPSLTSSKLAFDAASVLYDRFWFLLVLLGSLSDSLRTFGSFDAALLSPLMI